TTDGLTAVRSDGYSKVKRTPARATRADCVVMEHIGCGIRPTRRVALAVTCLAVLLTARGTAPAQVCAQGWQNITVSLNGDAIGALGTYTISTAVPNASGCDLTTSTVITIGFPGDTNAASISNGTLNGNPISFVTQMGQTVTFMSPIAVQA